MRLFLWAGVIFTANLMAQDAQELVDAAAKIYASTPTYAAQVDSRVVQYVFGAAAEGEAPRFDVAGTFYRRVKLKVRKPDDYWLSVQTKQEGAPLMTSGTDPREMMMMRAGMPGGAPSSQSVLARSGGGVPKRGQYLGGRYVTSDIPPRLFNSLALSGLGYRAEEDMVLKHFLPEPKPIEGNMSLGLVEPDLIGRELLNGRQAYRIVAKTSGGNPVMLWIDQESFLVVRSIVQTVRGRRVLVVESLFNDQQMNRAFVSNDFALGGSQTPDLLSAETMQFVNAADLVKLAQVAPDPAAAAAVAEAKVPETPVVPVAPPVTLEGQALSYEQMSGIILIEGDGGTASGFMAKIRDVDFVITNLHVLGKNKKITLKNLSGEEIPYSGIFGAVGSDVAIIRVAAVQGELKLAEDVLKSSKLGDKVVVVGNRQGGGVATQVAGSIVGVGPTRVEVNANFEPGNSGSPIVNLVTGEVIGVASYSQTRRVEVEETGSAAARTGSAESTKEEKRWFGYRLDGISKWEGIDLAKWNAQGERIEKFTELSEALVSVIKLDFNTARRHPRLNSLIANFEARVRASGNNSVTAATEVKDLFRVIRSISEDGMRDLTNGDYYDYYRTCLYWEDSIPAQLDYRKEIIEVLKKYEANSAGYLSRMRGGN
jgi:S1-C subfamily serine protease